MVIFHSLAVTAVITGRLAFSGDVAHQNFRYFPKNTWQEFQCHLFLLGGSSLLVNLPIFPWQNTGKAPEQNPGRQWHWASFGSACAAHQPQPRNERTHILIPWLGISPGILGDHHSSSSSSRPNSPPFFAALAQSLRFSKVPGKERGPNKESFGSFALKDPSASLHGCVWKCRVPHCTQWFCWSLSLLNGYNWEYTIFSDKPTWTGVKYLPLRFAVDTTPCNIQAPTGKYDSAVSFPFFPIPNNPYIGYIYICWTLGHFFFFLHFPNFQWMSPISSVIVSAERLEHCFAPGPHWVNSPSPSAATGSWTKIVWWPIKRENRLEKPMRHQTKN